MHDICKTIFVGPIFFFRGHGTVFQDKDLNIGFRMSGEYEIEYANSHFYSCKKVLIEV